MVFEEPAGEKRSEKVHRDGALSSLLPLRKDASSVCSRGEQSICCMRPNGRKETDALGDTETD